MLSQIQFIYLSQKTCISIYHNAFYIASVHYRRDRALWPLYFWKISCALCTSLELESRSQKRLLALSAEFWVSEILIIQFLSIKAHIMVMYTVDEKKITIHLACLWTFPVHFIFNENEKRFKLDQMLL